MRRNLSGLRRIVLILLALVVLVPSVAHASTRYQGGDGVFRTACCCPTNATHHDAPASDTRLRAACCCKVTLVAERESSARESRPITIDDSPAVAPVEIALSPIEAPPRTDPVERSRAPRGPPESLFVRHCSLLL